jgi:hypothetical protein
MKTREELMNTENARKARPRSFFTRKLESKLEEKEDRIPQTFLSLLDLPFDDFTPEDHELYEKQLKPLFRSFSAVLLEIFDQMGRPEEGWEESTKLLSDCPVKVVAMLALYEFRNSSNGHGDTPDTLDDYMPPQTAQAPRPAQASKPSPMERIVNPPPPPSGRGKTPVKKPAEAPGEQKGGKWWEKKIF